ncbi:hypothetical protein MHPYR_600035 [uncultured Mycobacterium sp.]|uniref:Uncharacterized protein n=1 Tax=uncultured Mycobacterium sp. TaxID=171292 RepID=A0A1Y5PRG1_9MYCO|nr:hypothetical protein MHPYR_600035 [uncultured Mycobacterium sp.]
MITGASTTAAARSFFPETVLRAFGPAFADESAEDVVFPEFPVSAAATAGSARMTPPTPRASANAPTRPMCCPMFIPPWVQGSSATAPS